MIHRIFSETRLHLIIDTYPVHILAGEDDQTWYAMVYTHIFTLQRHLVFYRAEGNGQPTEDRMIEVGVIPKRANTCAYIRRFARFLQAVNNLQNPHTYDTQQ